MIEQRKVDRVASGVLAAMPAEERHVDAVDPAWHDGDVLLNLTTGEQFHIRYVDRDRSVIGVSPRPNVG